METQLSEASPAADGAASVPARPPRSLLVRAVVAGAHLVARVFGGARDAVARALLALGLTPNTVTLVGPVVAAPVAVAWYLGNQQLGGWLLVAASAFDLLDGAVARIGGKVTRFGGFLDSVIDRYSDFILFTGIYLYFLGHTSGLTQKRYLVLWALGALGALLPAYIRARAETLIPLCKVGFMERAERTVTVIIGAIAGNLHLAILVVAAFGNLMSIERILYTREELEPRSRRFGRMVWRYERLSPPHAVLCAVLIALLLFGHHLVPRP
jgi:CDP-diacylglycerol--glycerol-3-phosphate 3-phosphatidyltransferase